MTMLNHGHDHRQNTMFPNVMNIIVVYKYIYIYASNMSNNGYVTNFL